MSVEIALFEPTAAIQQELEGYFDVFIESSRRDRPDALLPGFDALMEQIRVPHPAFGEQRLWLAHRGGRIAGIAELFLVPEPNTQLALVRITTHPRFRRQGIGTAMFRRILPEIAAADRSVIVGQGVTADGDGDAWALRQGFHETQRMVMLALELDAATPALSEEAAVPGYRAVVWRGPAPEEILDSYALSRNIIHEAPIGDATVEHMQWTRESVRAEEEALAATGVDLYVAAAVEESTGQVRALTVVHQVPGQEGVARQLDTAVHSEHRRRGLALWIKKAVIDRLHVERPDIVRVLSNVDPSNAAMLAVNERAGFRPVRAMISVEARLEDVRARIGGDVGGVHPHTRNAAAGA